MPISGGAALLALRGWVPHLRRLPGVPLRHRLCLRLELADLNRLEVGDVRTGAVVQDNNDSLRAVHTDVERQSGQQCRRPQLQRRAQTSRKGIGRLLPEGLGDGDGADDGRLGLLLFRRYQLHRGTPCFSGLEIYIMPQTASNVKLFYV